MKRQVERLLSIGEGFPACREHLSCPADLQLSVDVDPNGSINEGSPYSARPPMTTSSRSCGEEWVITQ
jgi:hypothetical protein